MAEVTGTATLPERVTISVPVFDRRDLAGIRGQILCALEPDAATQTFQLIPLAGEIETALADGEAAIGKMLRDKLINACIYNGKF